MSTEKDIKIKKTYDENDEQVYPITSVEAVDGLSDELSSLKKSIKSVENDTSTKIKKLENDIIELKNSKYNDSELRNRIILLEEDVSSIKDEISSLKEDMKYLKKINNIWYNIHLIKNKNGYYTVIENFDKELLNSDTYRIVFMKKSRRNTTGKTWTVPMFNDKDIENKYYYDSKYSLLTPTKAYWNVTGYKQLLWNGEYNIKDLPCLSIEKDNSKLGNKLFPHKNTQTTNPNIISPILTHTSDQSYRFKNSNNKKIKIGFAIYKLNGTKWERVSNIAEMELYAYNINKYIVNMI